MCNNCSKQIFKAFDFKATCLYIENKLVPYITSKETLLDLKEIYLKEQSNQQVINLEENQRICRLCFQPINGKFTSIDEVEVNTFNTFIPEVVSE